MGCGHSRDGQVDERPRKKQRANRGGVKFDDSMPHNATDEDVKNKIADRVPTGYPQKKRAPNPNKDVDMMDADGGKKRTVGFAPENELPHNDDIDDEERLEIAARVPTGYPVKPQKPAKGVGFAAEEELPHHDDIGAEESLEIAQRVPTGYPVKKRPPSDDEDEDC